MNELNSNRKNFLTRFAQVSETEWQRVSTDIQTDFQKLCNRYHLENQPIEVEVHGEDRIKIKNTRRVVSIKELLKLLKANANGPSAKQAMSFLNWVDKISGNGAYRPLFAVLFDGTYIRIQMGDVFYSNFQVNTQTDLVKVLELTPEEVVFFASDIKALELKKKFAPSEQFLSTAFDFKRLVVEKRMQSLLDFQQQTLGEEYKRIFETAREKLAGSYMERLDQAMKQVLFHSN